MKKSLTVVLLICCLIFFCLTVHADDADRHSGLFSYRLKGNGNAVITDFDWEKNDGQDVYVPRQIDGYNVSEIGEYAFSDKTAGYGDLKYNISAGNAYERYKHIGQAVVVILPDTITAIGSKAFFCSQVTTVVIPESVQLIGPGAFAGCVNIKQHSVSLGNPVYTTINGILYNKKTKELVASPCKFVMSIPEGIVSIGDYGLYGVELGDYKQDAFPLPSTLKTIGEYAFAYTRIHGPFDLNNVTDVKDYAFFNSTLRKIDFNKVERIGNHAFEGSYLGDISNINYASFDHDEMYKGHQSLVLPSSLISMGEYAFSGIEVSRDSYNGIMHLDLSKTKLTVIPSYAFANVMCFGPRGDHYFLEHESGEIIFPDGLLHIDSHAFENSGYSGVNGVGPNSVFLPSSLVSIGDYAFANFTKLSISFDTPSNLESIGEKAFYNVEFVIDAIELPEGIKELGDNAFFNNIPILYLPDSVNAIGENVCDRSVTKLKVVAGSYAAFYASENGFPTVNAEGEDTSWLND